MIARFPGTCGACGEAIAKGDPINFYGKGHAEHADCEDPGNPAHLHPDDYDESGTEEGFPPSRAELASDRRAARNGLTVIRTSGGTFTQNSRGRCEDAPCCGCCT
jgi:hypothetical protein